MPKRLDALPVNALLTAFSGDPLEAVTLFSKLYRYPNCDQLLRAISRDGRFRAPLRRVVAAFKDSDDAIPWMVHRLPNDPELVPALVEVWRAWKGQTSHAAELRLRGLGDRRGLEAMAVELGKTPTIYRVGPIQATMKLHVETAYDRIARMLEVDPSALWLVLGEVTRRHVAADERWAELALRAVEHPEQRARNRARWVLNTAVPRKLRERLLAKEKPADVPVRAKTPRALAAHQAALDAHRATIADLVNKLLPKGGFTRARGDAEKKLTQLAEILGQVPAAARAFYERIDAIEIRRGKPRDTFVVLPLAEVLAEARSWARMEKPMGKTRRRIRPFRWPVTPDGYTKAGLSGGEPYGFKAPTDDDDPVLNLPKKPTFMKFVTGAARLRKKV